MRQVIPFTKNIEFKTMVNEITNISLEHTLSLKDQYNVNGDFIITGKYKLTPTSPTEESFSYKIPIDIAIDSKYKTDNIQLEIDDFKYEKFDSNKLKVDIDLSIDNLEKKEETIKEKREEKVLEEVREVELEEFEPKKIEKKEIEEIETLDFNDRKILNEDEKKEINQIIYADTTEDLFKETSKPVPLTNQLKEEIKEEKITMKEEKTSVGSLFTAFKDTEETFSTYSVYIVRNGDNIEEIMSKYKTNRDILEEYNDMSSIKIGSKLIIPSVKDENNK